MSLGSMYEPKFHYININFFIQILCKDDET